MNTRYVLLPLSALFITAFAAAQQAAASTLPLYGRVTSFTPHSFVLNFHSTEEDTYFTCAVTPLLCQPNGTTTPQLLPDLVTGRRYFLNAPRDLALVLDPGGALLTLYRLMPNIPPVVVSTYAVSAPVSRAWVSAGGERVVVMTTDDMLTVYGADGAVLNSMPFARSGADYVTLSPKGNFLAYYRAATISQGERTIGIVDLKSMKDYTSLEKLRFWDLLSEQERLFSFSADEKRLAFLTDRDGYPTLYSLDLTKPLKKNFKGTRIILRKYSVSDFMYVGNTTMLIAANRESPLNWGLYLLNVPAQTVKKVSDFTSYGVALQRVGGYVAFTKLGATGGTPLLYDIANKTVVTIPAAVGRPTDPVGAKPETIRMPSGGSVTLWKPDGFSAKKSYPVVIWLHGGPYRQTSSLVHPFGSYGNFDWVLERLRRAGIVVAKVDYRGSYGYGRAFAEAIVGDVGKGDVKDVTNALASVQKRVKANGVYLMGNSYGGYLALRAVAERPSLFKGAISISGVTDWLTMLGNDPEGIFRVHFTGSPGEDEQARFYSQASIIDRITRFAGKQILLFHGDKDTSVSYNQAKIFYQFLQDNAVPSTLVTYQGEDHVFAKKADISDMCTKTLTFLGLPDNGSCALQ